jgi:hypothetical protein
MKKISPPNFGGEGGKVRLTRKGRKPRTSFYREPEPSPDWSPTKEDWEEIQDAYGHKLPDSLRSEIVDIVSDYCHFAQAERNKANAEDAIAFLVKLEEKASSLADLLVGDLKDSAAASARDALRTHYFFEQDDPDFEHCPYESKIEAFAEALRALASATMAFASDMNADAEHKPLRKKPDAWDVMIVRLTEVVAAHNLPSKAVKGSASEFVILVQELQELFPAEYRLHQYGRGGEISMDAAEKAIFEAQDAFRTHQERRKKVKLYLRFRRMRPSLKKCCQRRPDLKSGAPAS